MSDSAKDVVTVEQLPVTFQVKYLGFQPAKGLWGIKHTRRPVDNMVQAAKELPQGTVLAFVKLIISTEGITIEPQNKKDKALPSTSFSIETISYGVQDLVYTRVFSMIVVKDSDLKDGLPFDCHAFVCESRNSARRLTYALAAAFQEYSKRVREENPNEKMPVKKKFAIDLRDPHELQEELEEETEA